MSKRHQASRRRTYGRRQHELHERVDRHAERIRIDPGWADPIEPPDVDPLAFLDPRSPRLRYGFD